jgi:hypothetical protein
MFDLNTDKCSFLNKLKIYNNSGYNTDDNENQRSLQLTAETLSIWYL